jgi:hypothetical protein
MAFQGDIPCVRVAERPDTRWRCTSGSTLGDDACSVVIDHVEIFVRAQALACGGVEPWSVLRRKTRVIGEDVGVTASREGDCRREGDAA